MPSKAKDTKSAKLPARTTRSRSRSRSRSRGRSPARKGASSPKKIKSEISESPKAERHILTRESERKAATQEIAKATGDSAVKLKVSVSKLSQSVITSSTATSTTTMVHRHSARIAEIKESILKDQVDSANNLNEASNNTQHKSIELQTKTAEKAKEVHAETAKEPHGGNFLRLFLSFTGAVALLCLTVLVPLMLTYGCRKKSCVSADLIDFGRIFVWKLEYYWNTEIVLYTAAWVLANILLSYVPLGPMVQGPNLAHGKKQFFRCNGSFVMLFLTAVIAVEYYYGFQVNLAYTKINKFLVGNIVVAVALGLMLYLMAVMGHVTQANEAGNTGFPFIDVLLGRDEFPRFPFGMDMKLVIVRTGMLTWMMMVGVMMLQSYKSAAIDLNVMFVGTYQLIYCAVFLLTEKHALSSLYMRSETVGVILLLGMQAFTPFANSLPTRFLLEHHQDTNYVVLAVCTFFFIVGMYVMIMAQYQKAEFKRDTNTGFAQIRGDKGRNLLTEGMWGVVRKPNYLGDIMANVAWTIPCGYGVSFVPYLPLAMIVLGLVQRIFEDEAGCKKRYGKTWDEYCSQVKYRICPYIF